MDSNAENVQAIPITIWEVLAQRRARTPSEMAIYERGSEGWQGVDWADYGQRIDDRASALLANGAEPGDRIALMGRNTLQWFVTDLAVMTSGMVTVPIYPTSSYDQVAYMLRHSGARWIFVECEGLLPSWRELFKAAPLLERIILFEGDVESAENRAQSVGNFQRASGTSRRHELNEVRRQIAPDNLATLIYTSGTTGDPKGVKLTHRNAVAASRNVTLALEADWGASRRISCSYLPLAHVAERVVSLMSPMLDRRTVYLCPDLDRILEDVREVRPTIWLAVPRIWEKMYEGVMVQLSGLAPRKRRLVEWALAAGQSWHAALQEGESHRLGLRARLKAALAEQLVTRKLRAALGLDRTQIAITGGAPGRSEVAEFFTGLGLWLQEVYGQTEGYGTTSLSLHTEFRPGSCGRPFPLVDVRIAEDGEILVRGDNVSPGYLDDDELTAETFCDGWLHSGDLGRLDDDGFLWVEGRKKDIIITSGGKNITPSKIEQAIATLPLVSAAVVIGEGRKYLSAIIYVDRNLLEDADPDDPEAAVRAVLDSHLDNVNASLSRPEQIKKYLVRFEDIEQDTELLTVTMKVKRHRIMGKFREDIDQLYAQE